MKTLLLLPFLLLLFPAGQSSTTSTEVSQVVVLSSKWSKDRLTVEQANAISAAPAAAMIPANKNFERNRRINDPAGVRDPNIDTIDGRSAQLDKTCKNRARRRPNQWTALRTESKSTTPAQESLKYCSGNINSSTHLIHRLYRDASFSVASASSPGRKKNCRPSVRQVRAM